MHVYRFERIDETLDLLPIAARRALDVAGVKVPLEAWRAAPIELRRGLTGLGSEPEVNADAVRLLLVEGQIASVAIPSPPEPAADRVPGELAYAVTAAAWRALSPLDRYALVKVTRGKHADEALPRALAEIAPISTHVDDRGQARMVDVGAKEVTARRAIARARVVMQPATAARLRAGDVAKGDVLATARVAAIQAAKRAPELIPLCHAIALTRVVVDFTIDDEGVTIEATCDARDRTGVEMEAMTAASVAALTVYDMLKSVDRGMRFSVELAEKSGGKTGTWRR